MKKLVLVALGVCLSMGLAGCPKKPTVKPGSGTGDSVPANGGGTGTAGANGGGGIRNLTPAGPATGTEEGTTLATVYFALDSSEIGGEYTSAISQAARRLAQAPAMRLRLEGNTDERGSPEYNIGLGERRAQAVKRALVLAGAPDAQILTVSYGAERPAVEGHDESAWAKNRRVDVVALGGVP